MRARHWMAALLIGLSLIARAARAQAPENVPDAVRPPGAGQHLLAVNKAWDVDPKPMEEFTNRLKTQGTDAAFVERILAVMYEADQEGFPAAPFLAKASEGARKNVEPQRIEAALKTRLEAFRKARELFRENGYGESEEVRQGPWVAAALAVESGLSGPALRAVLAKGRSASPDVLRTVLEAGETMRLSGLDEDTARGLMEDCLDRKLRRPEILEVLRLVRERRGSTDDGAGLRRQLWGGNSGAGGNAGSTGGVQGGFRDLSPGGGRRGPGGNSPGGGR